MEKLKIGHTKSSSRQYLNRYMPFIKTILFLSLTLLIKVDSIYSQTQRDWEIFKIKDIYSNKFSDTLYKKYEQTITKNNSNSYRFGNRILLTSEASNELELLLRYGLFYPQLVTGDSTINYSPDVDRSAITALSQSDTMIVSSFQEIEVYPNNYQKRRYLVYVWFKGILNPNLYTLELTDNTANETTSLQSFFKNASLTFLKFITILI